MRVGHAVHWERVRSAVAASLGNGRCVHCSMSDRSAIQWTDATWNPVTGCTEISPGCDHCYARRFAERFRGVAGHPYQQGFDLKLWPSRLDLPFSWKSQRYVFVNSMSDLFQDDVPD